MRLANPRLAGAEAPIVTQRIAATAGPSIGEQLRYIGRDGLTGMPAPVNDRFIAEVERAVERYGKDEQQAVPPPPAVGPQISLLRIPSLETEGPMARFGLDRFGRLDVPQDSRTIGWHPAYTSVPGHGGATFLAAHFEYVGRAGVFNRISRLGAGDELLVALSDGSAHRYGVMSAMDYALGAIDMGAILYGLEGRESLTLMTCSGPANEGEYAFRTVVLANRIDA